MENRMSISSSVFKLFSQNSQIRKYMKYFLKIRSNSFYYHQWDGILCSNYIQWVHKIIVNSKQIVTLCKFIRVNGYT